MTTDATRAQTFAPADFAANANAANSRHRIVTPWNEKEQINPRFRYLGILLNSYSLKTSNSLPAYASTARTIATINSPRLRRTNANSSRNNARQATQPAIL